MTRVVGNGDSGTVPELSKACGIERDQVRVTLRFARIEHGVDRYADVHR